ncbi:MAG: glucose 1-dehydrogenase [Woeseia sp.]|nr:glucose 1-dehydrogenase [Woeseia sp.]MBT8095835.1 glucose 1-dehydrogenase [Woeseia sp.]NNE61715.1 glucose 1-dehydrogenase [Woeseia sp.]NNL55089.1 glucose 1-dehydrogenase [Woeseia sp.]
MDRVKGKVALVTGAAQGIGAAVATMLAAEGAKVLVTDINTDGATAEANRINDQYPAHAIALTHDVTSPDDWRIAMQSAEEHFGGLHVLVNNAGIGALASVEDETLENWRYVHAVDLDSVFLGCKLALPLMRASGGGSIINVSSISGIIAAHNLAAYNSAKAAVRHLSKSVALHCARENNNVRSNSVHPVFIDTPILDGMMRNDDREAALTKLARQIPLGRVGKTADVAYAILFLASDESSFITGTEIRIDGGISAM